MRKYINFVLPILILFYVIIYSSCEKSPRYYIALGDSVSSGHGLNSQEENHPTIFFNLLKNDLYVDNYLNLAVAGYTTTQLIEQLQGLNTEGLKIFNNARVVTINIGGNNILVPFSNYLTNNPNIVSGTNNIVSGTESIIGGSRNVISGITSGILDYLDGSKRAIDISPIILSGIDEVISGAENIKKGTGEFITGSSSVFSALRGSFSPELNLALENGVRTFSDDFLGIIAFLKKNAPEAVIIVNTIYNPIPQQALMASLELSFVADAMINSMNSIIIQESLSQGYLVSDIYTYLTNQLNLMAFNINPSIGNLSFDIIHPNAKGHYQIAQLNYDTFTQNRDVLTKQQKS